MKIILFTIFLLFSFNVYADHDVCIAIYPTPSECLHDDKDNNDDKLLGAICIDFGSESTSVSVFENEKLIFLDSINIGGTNITKDLAKGISTTIESAERLKTLYGSVITSPSDEHELIDVPYTTFDLRRRAERRVGRVQALRAARAAAARLMARRALLRTGGDDVRPTTPAKWVRTHQFPVAIASCPVPVCPPCQYVRVGCALAAHPSARTVAALKRVLTKAWVVDESLPAPTLLALHARFAENLQVLR